MGFLRACVCQLLFIATASTIGACSDDDDGGSAGAACHCEWGDTCEEMSASCGTTECVSDGENVKASGACDDTDVIGTCDCTSEDIVVYYRSSFLGDPEEDCEFWCDGAYTARN